MCRVAVHMTAQDYLMIGPYNKEEVTITLLRDGKEEVHCFHNDQRLRVKLTDIITHSYVLIGAPIGTDLGAAAISISYEEAEILTMELEELHRVNRIKDLEENGPRIEPIYDSDNVIVILLRNGNELGYRFHRDVIREASPSIYETCYLKTTDITDTWIWVSSREVTQMQEKLMDILYAEGDKKEEEFQAFREQLMR